MAQKIKFSIIQSLFRLFSFLADKTGGWRVFVQPKLWFGVMIIGTISACGSSQTTRTICYEMPAKPIQQPTCYEPAAPEPPDEPSCYKQVAPEPPDIPAIKLQQTTCYKTDIVSSPYPQEKNTQKSDNDTIKPAPTDKKIPIEVINSVQPPMCYKPVAPNYHNKNSND